MKSNNQGTPNKPAEAGQGFVEYALILILVGIAVILVVSLMQPAIGDVFSRFVAQAPVAPPSLLTYTPPPTATNTSTPDPDNPNPPDPPPATETATPSQTPTPSTTPTPSITPTPSATPICGYGPHTVPANGSLRMQMQNFRCGGPGISFFDQTNDGGPGSGAYRTDYGSEGPDLEGTSDSTGGGWNLAYTLNGEWVEYEVITPSGTAAAVYTFIIRHAAASGSNPQIQIRTTHFESGTQANTETISLGSTGGWQTWQNRAVNVVLFEGTNIVRFNIVSGNGNYNYIDIQTAAPPTATPTPVTPTATTIPTDTPIPPTPPTPVTITFISNASHDGDVRAQNAQNNSGGPANSGRNEIYVGDDGNDRQYIGIVSFNTSPIPANAVITSVELRLRQQGTRNTPFGDLGLGTLYADIAPFNGFGGNYDLIADDFEALAAATNVITFNEPAGNLAWATGQLGASHYAFINRTDFTQFKIHFEFPDNDNRTEDQFRFYSSNHGTSANRPQLIVTYYIP